MKERNERMAGRMVTQKTLFLDEEDYNTFQDFIILINDLASNLDEEEVDELYAAIYVFIGKVEIKK